MQGVLCSIVLLPICEEVLKAGRLLPSPATAIKVDPQARDFAYLFLSFDFSISFIPAFLKGIGKAPIHF